MITNVSDCLLSKGIISSAQADSMNWLASSLPSSNFDLLRLIALTSLYPAGSVSGREAVGTESIQSNGTVKTLDVPATATAATITAYENNIIFRVDGTDPASNAGHSASVSENFLVEGNSLQNFKFIPEAGSATIFVTYFK